jgi:hypothetical protein
MIMDLKIVNLKIFKKIFFNFLVICILIVAGGFILYKTGTHIFPELLWALSLKNVILYALAGLVLIVAFYIISQKQKLKKLKSFEEKIRMYEHYYTRRLWWHVVSCLTTAVFLLLTWHILFLYFGMFDLLSMLGTYPSKDNLKRELDEDDLIFS